MLLAYGADLLVGYANGWKVQGFWKSTLRPRGKAHRLNGWELGRTYLLPGYIGKGVGKGLLDRWEQFLRRKKARRYFVSYNARNRLARDFYRRNGFARAREYDDGNVHAAVRSLRQSELSSPDP